MRGVARLISSARTTWAKSGPGWKTNWPVGWWKTLVPIRSLGSRSGVNWMRWKEQARLRAQRLGQQRLADAGHVLDQEVPLGQQGDQGEMDDLGLAEEDGAQVAFELVNEGERLLRGQQHLLDGSGTGRNAVRDRRRASGLIVKCVGCLCPSFSPGS